MIKCVFFDVDGTLLSHRTGCVPASTICALQKLQKAGLLVIMATGRHRLELEELPMEQFPFDGYVTLNGQLIFDRNWNLLQEYPIVGEAKKCLIEIFDNRSVPIILVEKDQIYINYVDDYVRKVQHDILSSVPQVGHYSGENIFLAVAYVSKEMEKTFSEQLTQLCVTRWHDQAIDITPADGGKVRGIKYYLEMNRISQKETMVFGDSENDIEMLRYAEVGVAMGNSVDAVKREADYVTADIDNDGIWKALVEYGLIS